MDGREPTTRRGVLRRSAGLGTGGAAVVRKADATRCVDDRSVRLGPR